MAKKQVQPPVKLSDLTPDPGNYNAGTEEGQAMLERSLQKLGFGRSILLDKHGRVLAGNKTLQGAQAAGFADEDLQVIQTDGKKVIALQRMDLDLDTQEGKNMALADNAVARTNIAWDFEALGKDGWTDETLGEWGVTDWQKGAPDYSGKNKEIDVDDMEEEMTITLKYTPDEFWKVKEQLSKIGQTPEAAIWILLGNDKT